MLRRRSATPQGFIAPALDQHPRFRTAVLADARFTATILRDPWPFTSRVRIVLGILRLMWRTDAFFALCCYRAKARLQQLRIPVLPTIAHRLAMATGQVCIGDPVVIDPGIHLAHGSVVIDGVTRIERLTQIRPWVTIGLVEGRVAGPTIRRRSTIGTGAKVLGDIEVGPRARIGAGAVVLADVPADATAVGVPARIIDPEVSADASAPVTGVSSRSGVSSQHS